MEARENYNDLYTFMMVAQEGSFTRAAARLGMAQPGVSRTIRGLENRLGMQLISRSTRKLSLTQAGEQLYRTTRASFEQLNDGLIRLSHLRDTPSGTVRINASQHAIDRVLLPRLAGFSRLYPDIRLELISESRLIDIIDMRFDAGVRLGRDVGEGMIAVRIGENMEMAIVATPEHFRRHGFPRTPQDLDAHPCIAYQFADGSLYAWELDQAGQRIRHWPQGQWVLSDSYMEVAAARNGLGLAYVPLDLVADDIARGHLIRVLKPCSCTLTAPYLYYPHRNVSRALRAVVDTLRL